MDFAPSLAEGDKDRDRYLAIGESDRMTLRFVRRRTELVGEGTPREHIDATGLKC